MKKIFIITGEHSGDIHAANVVKELKKNNSDIEIEGIGGANLANEGVKLFSDHSKMGAVGMNLKIVLDHFSLGKRLVDYIKKAYKPDLVLLIDYGTFNLNIAKALKGSATKVFYYIPPQVWASRKWRLNTIKKFVDKVFCIFPFEKEMYEEQGISTHYCGHPLVKQLPDRVDRNEFFQSHQLDFGKKLVSIFPGSRVFELKHLMKLFVTAAKELRKKHPELQFCVSQAPNIKNEVFEKYFNHEDFKVIKGENQALLSVSDALILASGTVALEATLYQTPMIIAYRGPWLFYLVYLLVRCIKKVSLPNIITGKDIVPELIQGKLSVNSIVTNIEQLLYDESIKTKQIQELSNVREILTDKYSAQEVATDILAEICQ